jgi:hypothetical protein
MFTYKKFFDIDLPDAPSIATIMAQKGALNSTERGLDVPKVNTSDLTKPTPTEPATPAPATAAKTGEPAKVENQPPAKAAEPAPVQTEQATKQPTWQEVLKQQQPNAILKELGYGEPLAEFLSGRKELDPKIINFLKHWETSDGNMEPYLRALSTDYAKMPPEEVMRHHLKEQYPELDAKQLDTLYKVKVLQRYKLDPTNFSEEEVEEGRIELLADAKPIRASLIEQQQGRLLPKPETKQPETDPRVAQQEQGMQEYRTSINEHPYIKNMVATKQLTVGKGEDQFNLPVDPNRLLGILNNPDDWATSLYNKVDRPDGKSDYVLNVEKNALVSAILADDVGTIDALAKHYKAIGAKAAVAPIENASEPGKGTPAKAEVESSNPATAMAKRGRITRGGE